MYINIINHSSILPGRQYSSVSSDIHEYHQSYINIMRTSIASNIYGYHEPYINISIRTSISPETQDYLQSCILYHTYINIAIHPSISPDIHHLQ